MIMLDSSTILPGDLTASKAVPGKGKAMPAVSLEGGYNADFNGVNYQVTRDKLVRSSKYYCCLPNHHVITTIFQINSNIFGNICYTIKYSSGGKNTLLGFMLHSVRKRGKGKTLYQFVAPTCFI